MLVFKTYRKTCKYFSLVSNRLASLWLIFVFHFLDGLYPHGSIFYFRKTQINNGNMNYEHLIQKMEEIISLLPSKKNEGGGLS